MSGQDKNALVVVGGGGDVLGTRTITRLVYYTSVAKIETRKRIKRGWKDDKGDSHFDEQDLGWVLQCAGSLEALHIGDEGLDWLVGQKLKVTIEPV